MPPRMAPTDSTQSPITKDKGSPPENPNDKSCGENEIVPGVQTTHEFLAEQVEAVQQALAQHHQRMLSSFRERRLDVNDFEERVDTLLEENKELRAELNQLKIMTQHSTYSLGPPSTCAFSTKSRFCRDALPALVTLDELWSPPAQPRNGEVHPPRGESPPTLNVGGFMRVVSEPGKEESHRSKKDDGLFDLHDVWKVEHSSRVLGSIGVRTDDLSERYARAPELTDPEDVSMMHALTTNSCMKNFMVHPNNSWKGGWDISSLFLVLYDTITIPLGVFDREGSTFFMFMEWVTRIFWSVDMPLAFFSGFITQKGSIEMRPRYVAMRYMKSWFILDTLVVSIDWMEILFTAGAETMGFARFGGASRIFRIIRMLRLLRLARMKEVLNLLIERVNSEKLVIAIDITKLMVIMLGAGHLVACLWYWFGRMDTTRSWLIESHYDNEEIPMQYMMSMRWAISQFAGGMDEVTPNSLVEQVFALIVFLWAFWSGAVFLGILTSSMTQLYIIGSTQTTQLTQLRRYLRQNGISKNLSLRVQRNAQHSMAERQTTMPEAAVELITAVSEPLRVELHYEMYSHVVAAHPFFHRYMNECPHVMRKVCHGAVSFSPISVGDVIFNVGEIPSVPRMFLIHKGMLMYSSDSGNNTTLGAGEWLSEMTLWVPWVHRGTLTSVTDAHLHTVDAKEFMRIASSFEHQGFDPKVYAAEFLNLMNNTPKEDLNDMRLPGQSELLSTDQDNDQARDGDGEIVQSRPRTNVAFELFSRAPSLSTTTLPALRGSRRMSASVAPTVSETEKVKPEVESDEDETRSQPRKIGRCPAHDKESEKSRSTVLIDGGPSSLSRKLVLDGVRSMDISPRSTMSSRPVCNANSPWSVCYIDEEEM